MARARASTAARAAAVPPAMSSPPRRSAACFIAAEASSKAGLGRGDWRRQLGGLGGLGLAGAAGAGGFAGFAVSTGAEGSAGFAGVGVGAGAAGGGTASSRASTPFFELRPQIDSLPPCARAVSQVGSARRWSAGAARTSRYPDLARAARGPRPAAP